MTLKRITFKKRITELRKMRLAMDPPMYLREVADALAAIGHTASWGHLSNVERGHCAASLQLLAALAKVYKRPRRDVEAAYAAAVADYGRIQARRAAEEADETTKAKQA